MDAATRDSQYTHPAQALYIAFELSSKTWKLGLTVGFGQKARERDITAGDLLALQKEIVQAKKRFGLRPAAPVYSCYEAGRDGFWIRTRLSASLYCGAERRFQPEPHRHRRRLRPQLHPAPGGRSGKRASGGRRGESAEAKRRERVPSIYARQGGSPSFRSLLRPVFNQCRAQAIFLERERLGLKIGALLLSTSSRHDPQVRRRLHRPAPGTRLASS